MPSTHLKASRLYNTLFHGYASLMVGGEGLNKTGMSMVWLIELWTQLLYNKHKQQLPPYKCNDVLISIMELRKVTSTVDQKEVSQGKESSFVIKR